MIWSLMDKAVTLLLLLAVTAVVATPGRMPIGLLYSTNALDLQTAVRYELEKHNNSTTTRFKLDQYFRNISSVDSYTVCQAMCAIVDQGVLALFGFSDEPTRSVIEAFTRTFRMPYVTTGTPVNDTSSRPGVLTSDVFTRRSYTVHLRPLYDRAIVDIIRHYRWQNISYVYDTNDGLMRLENLYKIANDPKLRLEIDAVRLTDVNDCYMTLRQLDSSRAHGNKYIIVDLSNEDAIQSVLKQIQAVGMNRIGYHYLIAGIAMDELDLDDFRHGGVNITGFTLLDMSTTKAQSLQKEWSRLNAKQWTGAGNGKPIKLDIALTVDAISVILHGLAKILSDPEAELHRAFRHGKVYNNKTQGIKCRSTSPMPWVFGPDILSSLLSVDFNGATGPIAFDEQGFRKNYKLNVHELNLDRSARKIGVWNYTTGLELTSNRTETTTMPPPVNGTRIVTTIISPPYLSYKINKHADDKLEGNDRFEGYCADLAKQIAKLFGEKYGIDFNYKLQLVKDEKYGAKEKDGTWNGMVGELTRGEADVAIAPLTILAMRERVIDFTKPFMQLGISIMIKKPEKQKPGVFSFMDPLSYSIWLCIVLSYLGVSTVLFLVSRFSPHEWQIEDRENGPTFTNDFTMLNSLWFSLGAFMRQGIDISPRSLSGRIVGSAWWFFTLIIISSYTANLAAFLTVERMLTPIENADDLAKQREIQYGTLNSGSTKEFFKNSRISVYERMWEFMNNNPDVFVATTKDGIDKVRNSKGKYAFLLESTMNDYYNQRKPCNTMKVGGDLDSKGYGIATPIGSNLREPIGLVVLELLESGFLQKLHKKWWYDKGECVPDDPKGGSSQSALTLSNVAGIFYILIGGLGLSMIMSLLEYMYKSKKAIIRHKKTFSETTRTKARRASTTTLERENGGYSYTAPSQVSGYEHYAEVKNTQTQV